MAFDFQLVVDAADPHTLADWWAAALGWEVEAQDEELIRASIAQGQASEADTALHGGKLVWKVGAAIAEPSLGRRILFQRVPESKTVKNRVHMDIRVGRDAVDDQRRRLEDMGATFLWVGSLGPFSWVTMADPEGNEFCIA